MAKGTTLVGGGWPAKASLTIMLLALGGIAQATPIVNFSSDLETSKPAAKPGASKATQTAPVSTAAIAPVEPVAKTASLGGPSLCEITATCRTTVKVPEPQSLVLLGSGLLSMAGLIRRKLLR